MSTKSRCINYSTTSAPYISTITASDYPTNPYSGSSKPILPVRISTNNIPLPGTAFTADISIGNTINYQLDIKADNSGEIRNQSAGMSYEWPKGQTGTYTLDNFPYPIPNASVQRIKLSGQNQPFNDGDQYEINLLSCFNSQALTLGADVTFSRKNNVVIDENVCNDKDCFCTDSCKTTRIPIITIQGQSMLDGSDVSDMTFTIFDTRTYEEKKCIVTNKNQCQLLRAECNKLKETKFIKCCPWMVSVVKGEGSTLREKLQYLINTNQQPNNLDINGFLERIIRYGMTRYILSRILYGNFNVKYLLEKYYIKFIKDLGRSRFCRFIEFFQDCTDTNDNFVGYEKYFLYEC
jgi:hypothetical protein